MAEAPPNPPQTPPVIRRSRPLWPFLLLIGAGAGGYALWTTTLKTESPTETEKIKDDTETSASPSTPPSTLSATISITEKPAVPITVVTPKARDPIPEDQQRELFRWILEEKRKVKPKGRDEKKRLDEDKAVLKQFIRAKSIPNL